MARCVIITSFQSSGSIESFSFYGDDYIICADGGYRYAKAAGITPHIVIGDFDSMQEKIANPCEVIRLKAEKDDTDTLVCLNHGIKKGYDEFVILGGLGGRLDHTVANLQAMSHAVDLEKSIWIIDDKNRAAMISPGRIVIPKLADYKISLFAYSDLCKGVSISGVKYPLVHHLLEHSFPLGVSNEFMDDKAEISLTEGRLLIILSQD